MAGYDSDERTALCSSWLQSTLTPQGIGRKSANIHQRVHKYDFNEAFVFKRFWVSVTDVEVECVFFLFFYPLSSTCTHTLPASLTALSEVQPEVCPTRPLIPMMSVSSKPEQLLRDFAPRLALGQKWNIVVAELFPNTRMIHTDSVRFPECSSACLTVPRPLPSPTL